MFTNFSDENSASNSKLLRQMWQLLVLSVSECWSSLCELLKSHRSSLSHSEHQMRVCYLWYYWVSMFHWCFKSCLKHVTKMPSLCGLLMFIFNIHYFVWCFHFMMSPCFSSLIPFSLVLNLKLKTWLKIWIIQCIILNYSCLVYFPMGHE